MGGKSGQAGASPGRLRVGIMPGQASVELISIMGISLLVVFVFSILAAQFFSDASSQQDYSDARSSVKALAEAAESVYAQGEGATRVVFIKLPPNTAFGSSQTYVGAPSNAPANAEEKAISISVEGTDVSAYTSMAVSGSLPPSIGAYRMKVVSRGSYVSIFPYVIDLDRYAVFVSMAQNESRQATVKVYGAVSEPVNVEVSYDWFFQEVNFTVSPVSFSTAANSTTLALLFNSSQNASGMHNSQLIINATGSASGISDSISIPITVDVQAG